jgi:predicted phosphate transport protein (TIGR00153 family)
MFNKYFGFMDFEDENSVLESFLSHGKMEQEEIILLEELIDLMCEGHLDEVEAVYRKIRDLHVQSSEIFQNIMGQIIESSFNYKKQYDLLRLYQRTEKISNYIMASSKRVLIFKRLGEKFPEELRSDLELLVADVKKIYDLYADCLTSYMQDRRKVWPKIREVENAEHEIDRLRAICLETLYVLGNKKRLPLGSFRVLEEIIDHLEGIADMVEEAATSIDWLLIKST